MRIGNLTFGGKIRRDMAAYRWWMPLASYQHPSSREWLWSAEAYRHRPSSGCWHNLYRRSVIPGVQSRVIWDVAGLFSVQVMRQRSAYAWREVHRLKRCGTVRSKRL